MIAKMKKIEVIGMKSQRKAVMELLQQMGAVEFSEQEDDAEGLESIDVSDRIMQFERYLSVSAQALSVLDEYAPEKTGMFQARKEAPLTKFSMAQGEAKSMGDLVFGITAADKKIHELNVEIGRVRGKIASLKPWEALDVPLNFGGTDKTVSAIAFLPFEADYAAVEKALGDAAEKIYFEITDKEKDSTRIFFLYLREDAETAERAIREGGFLPPSFSLSHFTPTKKIEQLTQKIESLESDVAKQKQFLSDCGAKRRDIQMFYDHIVLRRDKYEQLEKLKQTEKTFVLEGYVPEKRAKTVKEKIEASTLSYAEISEVPESEEAPVLFVNGGFARPVEGITKTYSMPGKTDIDPNGIMAFFYYLFFGMMFSDAGYGLLLALGAGYLGFIAKTEKATRENMRMFCYCGISTTFWGLMYGSFFGNVIPVVSGTFFGAEHMLKPLWLDPVQEPLTLLIFSVALGLVQIIVGLGIKFYMLWRQGEKASAVFDVGLWILILLGVCALAGGKGLGNEMAATVGMYMMIVGAVGLVLTQGRDKKNVFARLLSGVISLYDVTSYVSDALSYSRLMALGLATGVIAQVVNTMGSLGGGGIVNGIVFAVVFVVGHALNFAINCLGAYVHTNRLQYVEFFSKFYEGGGRAFSPLGMNTKYYEFMEE